MKNIGLMGSLGRSSPLTGVFIQDCYLPPRVYSSKLLKRQQKMSEDSKVIRYRLKPGPDPSRPEAETKWFTRRQIEVEAKKPSQEWIEAGSGTVGKYYLEILGCDGLPNMDVPAGSNKSDPFVCIAFEDCVVNSDVINNCLSPRWMPWTRRAFIFNVMHPSSQFQIAVLDHDGTVLGNPKLQHSKLGRCVVNPTNTRPNTMYTLRYNLSSSDEVDRKVLGQITFRLRFESSNERQFLFAMFQMRTHYDLSTNSKTESTTTKYALTNDVSFDFLSFCITCFQM